MYRLHLLSALLCLVVGATGCVEPFSANVDPPSPRPLVVNGGITSGPGPHSVTLTLAAAFEQSLEGAVDRISGAEVVIVDDSTGSQVLLQEGDLSGTYRTQEGELVGRPGHAYHVEITLPDGRTYRSIPERMPDPVPIDSLSIEWDQTDERIKVLANASDPADTSNYYRWSSRVTIESPIPNAGFTPPFFCWLTPRTFQISVRSDRLIDGGRITDQTAYSVEPDPRTKFLNQVDIQQHAITQEAYEFWSKVQTQVENAGDPFSPPPAPIRGNVVRAQDSTNYALGYFEVSGISQPQTICFRQSGVEGTPPPSSVASLCGRNTLYDRPSHWTCSNNNNREVPTR